MGLCRLRSGALTGIDAIPVDIEADASRMGDPQIVIVGLPDATVRESRDRVSTAISNSGYAPFEGRITVNLAPADVKKDGSLFDLPIAVAILAASDEISLSGESRHHLPGLPATMVPLDPKTTALAGELSLGGEVRPVRGILPLAIRLREAGVRSFLVPAENANEAAVVEGLDVYPVHSLRHAADILSGADAGQTGPLRIDRDALFATHESDGPDFGDVKGQEMAKRAMAIAVAGGHNILLMGPPGTGKSMLARCVPSILPPMILEEALESTKVHSIAGLLPPDTALLRTRAFRSPHHTVSDIGLIGGGTHPAPGEVSLAHNGVLFLDELPEFNRSVLEVLRQPMEDGFVTISRASGSARFPSRFMLVAAMNPCPCGFLGDPNHPCRCTPTQIQHYRSRISGPLLDRIDLHITVQASRLQDLQTIPKGATSEQLRAAVCRARARQTERFAGRSGIASNGAMVRRDLEEFCHMNDECLAVMNFAMNELRFSPRSHDRILKVARTIADLAGHEELQATDLQEALGYRALDRSVWS